MILICQACADKLKREMEEYGCPPNFPKDDVKADTANVRTIFLNK